MSINVTYGLKPIAYSNKLENRKRLSVVTETMDFPVFSGSFKYCYPFKLTLELKKRNIFIFCKILHSSCGIFAYQKNI